MKHYIGKKVIICDRYKEYHHAVGRILSINDDIITVRLNYINDKHEIHHYIIQSFPKKKIRDYYQPYDKYYEDDDDISHYIYQGIIHKINLELGIQDDDLFETYKNNQVAFITKHTLTKNKNIKNKTIVFSTDVERFLQLFYRSFFRRKLNFICDLTAPKATIYIKD